MKPGNSMQTVVTIILLHLVASSVSEGGENEPRSDGSTDQGPGDAISSLRFEDDDGAAALPKSGGEKDVTLVTLDASTRGQSSPPECCPDVPCKKYRGKLSVTVSGKKCQPWDKDTPHKRNSHVKKQSTQTEAGLESNYCRNPTKGDTAWCYTQDPETKWEYCDLQWCNAGCCKDEKCKDYRGTLDVTVSGKKCQSWDKDFPHERNDKVKKNSTRIKAGLESNYCRNPTNGKTAWCYTQDAEKRWDYCDTQWCNKGCCWEDKCKDYRGDLVVTVSGKKCQSWNDDYPHRRSDHVRKDSTMSEAGLKGRYCRNPTNAETVWCYTQDPATKWEYCDLRWCDKNSCEHSKCSTEGGICEERPRGPPRCKCKEGWKGDYCDQRVTENKYAKCPPRKLGWSGKRSYPCDYGRKVMCGSLPGFMNRKEKACRKFCDVGRYYMGFVKGRRSASTFLTREKRKLKGHKFCHVLVRPGEETTWEYDRKLTVCNDHEDCVENGSALRPCYTDPEEGIEDCVGS